MPTITDANIGNEIATNSILKSIVMTSPPVRYDDDYLCLVSGERVVFNLHIATSAVSSGSNLVEGAFPFENLVLKNIPKGCTFDLEIVDPPTLTSLSPDTAASGDPDFTLSCIGTGFTSSTVIKFGGHDEPTTLVSDTEVTTGVKPSLFVPAVVPVLVHVGELESDPVNFTFTEPVVEE